MKGLQEEKKKGDWKRLNFIAIVFNGKSVSREGREGR